MILSTRVEDGLKYQGQRRPLKSLLAFGICELQLTIRRMEAGEVDATCGCPTFRFSSLGH